jgi:hypothetical protein
MKIIIVLVMAIMLSACATAGAQSSPSPGPIAKLTHADLQTAAAYATANGFPARAAVYTALDTQLTACENAIAAAGPKAVPAGSTVGIFTAFEVAAETVATGIPASVRVNCSAITIP